MCNHRTFGRLVRWKNVSLVSSSFWLVQAGHANGWMLPPHLKWLLMTPFPLHSSRVVPGGLQQIPFPVQREHDHPWSAGQGPVCRDHGGLSDHEHLGRRKNWYHQWFVWFHCVEQLQSTSSGLDEGLSGRFPEGGFSCASAGEHDVQEGTPLWPGVHAWRHR